MNIDLYDGTRTQYYPSNIFEFSEKLSKTLTPIGLADNGHVTIVKDEEHKIYAVDGCLMFYVSDTLEEAVKIFSRNKLAKLELIVELD